MKKIFSYFGLVLSIALMGVFTACNPREIDEQTAAGLGIKVFFPTKVVAGQPMTVSGTGMADVREVVFPGGITVTDIEHVGNGMIRLTAPAGIASEGGKLIVRSADDQAESSQDLTLGHTVVTGFSKQEGEEISGGEQLTIFGTDLEFISGCELIDPDGNPLILNDEDFYRKGTSTTIITIPKKIFEGAWVGKLFTFDGQVINLPELSYKPATDGGYWETVETAFWENPDPEGNGKIAWSSKYRFCLEGMDTNPDGPECIAEFPEELWNRIKSETFYIKFTADESFQVRIVTGWWNDQWPGPAENDIAPWNLAEMLIDNGDGTYSIEINFAGAPILDNIDAQHLLFTGNGYTPLKLYFKEDIWVDGGGHWETQRVPFWTNNDPEGNGKIAWSGKYRFCLEGMDTNPDGPECIAEFPEDLWNRIKSETFYIRFSADESFQVRIVTGWWNDQWPGPAENDIAPWNLAEMLIDNGDGTYSIEINFTGAPILDNIDAQHLLFTGNGYTPLELYFAEEVWVGGGDSGPKEVDFWVNDDPDGNGKIAWSGKYRFCLEGMDTNPDGPECIAEFPEDLWNRIKSETFYIKFTADESFQVRIVTGWWNDQWPGPAENDIAPWNLAEMLIDNGDGTYSIEINFTGAAILDNIDAQHLLFTGNGYTPLALYFLE